MKISEEAIHIRILMNEAKNMKKQVLETQACFLRMLENLEKFKIFRKKETSEEQKARSCMKQIETEIEKIFDLLPREEKKGEEKEGVKVKAKEVTRLTRPIRIRVGKRKEKIVKIEEELEDIKERLARLS